MRNRKSRVFLGVSLVLFAASVVEELIRIIGAYRWCAAEIANDSELILGLQVNVTGTVVFMIVPMALFELSFIRSCYKILKKQPQGAAKVCWVLSAVLAFLMFLLLWLQLHEIVALDQLKTKISFTSALLLFVFPLLLVSLVLGSIRQKQDGGHVV